MGVIDLGEMMKCCVILGVLFWSVLLLPGAPQGHFTEEQFLTLATNFLQRNSLPPLDFGTNNIKRFSINKYAERPGCIAQLSLKSGQAISFVSDGTNTEVQAFRAETRIRYDLTDAPAEKVAAVKALNLRNKLNTVSALELARKYFRLQGHREADFRLTAFYQLKWLDQRAPDDAPDSNYVLPYYRAEWYRKDVTPAEIRSGKAILPQVTIEVSGADTNLISYFKGFMPAGRDF
jgi:hypothetical protein